MALSLDDRVRRLERFRYRMLGMVNAQNAILVDLLCEWLLRESDPLAALDALKTDWLNRGEMPTPALRLIDPTESDLIGQEYREAIDQLATAIATRLRRLRQPPGR